MVAPAVERLPADDGRTLLQKEKENWVLALLARPTRRVEDFTPLCGETRLQATHRHLTLGRVANEGKLSTFEKVKCPDWVGQW